MRLGHGPGVLACLAILSSMAPEVTAQARKKGRSAPGITVASAPAVLTGHSGTIEVLAFSPDGALLASGGTDKTVRTWYTANPSPASNWFAPGPVRSVAFSPDGSLLAWTPGGGGESTIQVVTSGTGIHKATIPSAGGSRGFGFLPDGKTIVSGPDAKVRLFDVESAKEVRAFEGGPLFECLAVSPDGKTVAVATNRYAENPPRPNAVALLDLATGLFRGLPGVDFGCFGVAFTPDGRKVVAAGLHDTGKRIAGDSPLPEGALKVWDVASGRLLGAMPYGVRGDSPINYNPIKSWIRAMAISPDGSIIATDSNGQIDLWRVSPFDHVGLLGDRPSLDWSFTALAFSPDGRTLASAEKDARKSDQDSRIRLWVVPTSPGRPPRPSAAPAPAADAPGEVACFKGHGAAVSGVAFSRDGRSVISAGVDKVARVWDASTAQEVTKLEGHEGTLTNVVVSRDGKQALTGGDETARLWDLAAGREIRKFGPHPGGVRQVAMAPDASRVVTAGWDKAIRAWDGATGAEVAVATGHDDRIIGLAVSPDGRSFLTGSWDRTARLWDLASGRQKLALEGHTDKVGGVAFAADGHRALTAGTDRTLRLWDLASGKELTRVETGADCGWAVAITPDGRRALTVDGADLTVWDLQARTPPDRLKGHTDQILAVAVSPDGRLAATGSSDGTARVWRLPRPTAPVRRR